MRRLLFAAVLGALLLTGTTSALAQDGSTYTPETQGELTIEAAGEFAPGIAVTVTGDGFEADSLVGVTFTDQTTGTVVVDLETDADAEGVAIVEFELPADVLSGPHEVVMSGAAADGLIVQLRTNVFVAGSEPATTTEAATDDTTATTVASEGATDDTSGESGDSTATTDAALTGDSGDADASTADAGTDDLADSTDDTSDDASDDAAGAGDDDGGSAGFLIAVVAAVAVLGGGALFLVRRQS